MLTLLQIKDFAIVESLELELGSGFTAITGETGAGKSILIDALGLLLGARGDAGLVRSGCEKAELCAEFELQDDTEALAWLSANDLEQGNACLLRRLLGANGRSRAWINGTAVSLAQMQELGDHLVEIHGQNEHMLLTRSAEQMRLLDAGEHHAAERAAVEARFADWHAVEEALQQLASDAALGPAELELLQFQISELEETALPPEALSALETEHRLLARGSDVLAALQQALAMLEAEEGGLVAGMRRIAPPLQRYVGLDREIANASQALNEASINCEAARASLESALSRIDLSPERLAELELTLGRLHALARKHRVEPAQLHERLLQLKERFHGATTARERRQQLEGEQARLLQSYRESALLLHRARCARAEQLSRAVSELMQVLGMPGGVFRIEVQHDPEMRPGVHGDDHVEMLVSANPGVPPGPLRRVASGGELSRISLAIKVAVSGEARAATQVFDEVDAGIGGETAHAVGQLLRGLASRGQALCVTHLAQVAVCADRQYRVSKISAGTGSRVETALLEERERVDEIARMLGGRLSEQSRAHAGELLASARSRH